MMGSTGQLARSHNKTSRLLHRHLSVVSQC